MRFPLSFITIFNMYSVNRYLVFNILCVMDHVLQQISRHISHYLSEEISSSQNRKKMSLFQDLPEFNKLNIPCNRSSLFNNK